MLLKMVNYNKKAISPVVATALLLVVAVVAVVGFQSWFTTYQSGINVKVEQESAAGSSITLERLEAVQGKVYAKNTGTSDITVKVKVTDGGAGCNDTELIIPAQGVNGTNTGCSTLNQSEKYSVVAVSPDGVFSATMIAR